MIPRIKEIIPREKYKLQVSFDSGETVIYDVGDDISNLADFSILKTEHGLFENFQIDESRTCIYWSDRIDLPSDIILEYGKRIYGNSSGIIL